MADVYKRTGSPFWYFDYAVPGGSRVRKSTKRTNKREAQAVADAQSRILADEAQITGRVTTLQAALDAYGALLVSRHQPSARNALALTRKTLGLDGIERHHLVGSIPLHRVTGADVKRLQVERLAEGAAVQTVNHELKHLRAAMGHAKDMGFKVADITFKLGKTTCKTRDLSWEEFLVIYHHLAPSRTLPTRSVNSTWTPVSGTSTYRQRQEVQDLLVALVTSGGRWSEIATMTWDQIIMPDMDQIKLWGWKDQQERLVPIPEMAKAMYVRRHAARRNSTHLVFPGNGDQVRRQPTRAIADAMDACGLNAPHLVARHGRATVHSLRHTFASWLLQRGLALAEVQELLGHASPEMTQRYARYAKGQVVSRAAEALNQTSL